MEADAGALAFDEKADGDALDAAGAEAGGHFLPKQRADFVAEEAVDDAAGFLGADEVLVDVAGALEGVLDGFRVISLKTRRRVGTFGLRISSRCQLMDSPSRSSSVAR
jgi:hypothetical protein